MMNFPNIPRGTGNTNLRLLAIIRCILVAGQCIALAIAHFYLGLDLNYAVLIVALLALLGLAFLIFRKEDDASITEYYLHLLADIAILTVVLYLTGGSTNPFVSYYLVPITISAAILPWGYTWTIAGLSLLLYTILLFAYHPLDIFSTNGMHDTGTLNPHIIGMWINFVMSALLITYFVVKMARQLRERDEQLHRANEDRIRDEQIMSLATMAAGTAHELGTPLSTLSVLLNEIQFDAADTENAELMMAQVDRCKKTLRALVEAAERDASGQAETVAIDQYIAGIIDNWRIMRPATILETSVADEGVAPLITADSTLNQAINNLLNNAADASPVKIAVALEWSSDKIMIRIRDNGGGIDPSLINELGKPFITTKSSGLGVGLFLAEASIRRMDGTLHFSNHPGGGAVATVTIPRSDSG